MLMSSCIASAGLQVGRLLGKRLWSVAATFVGNDTELQAMVVRQVGRG
jgi:hypothetical protein